MVNAKRIAGVTGVSLGAFAVSLVAAFGMATSVSAAPIEAPTTVGQVSIVSVAGASGVLS